MTTVAQVKDRIVIEVAGFVVALELNHDRLSQRIRDRYAQFLGRDRSPHLTIAIEATPEALFVPIAAGNWVIDVGLENGHLSFLSYQEKGVVDVTSGVGRLEMAPEADIENFLRAVFAWLCLHHGALLLHAGGVRRDADGQGYVFFGPSGAGKTTTTSLSLPQATILSDDLVVIRPDGAGGCTLHGVPFRGELVEAPRANQEAPLKAIFRLHQSGTHCVHALPRSIAVAELAAAAPFVVGNHTQQEQLISVCNEIARRTPVCQLLFRKDPGFWKAIDEYFADVS